MRIAFISVSDQLGGSEAVLLQLVRGLRRARPSWTAHLILPGEGPLGERARAAGAEVTVVPMPASLAGFGEFATVGAVPVALPFRLLRTALEMPGYQSRIDAALERIVPDVVHTNGFKAHVVAARSRAARHLVWHVHEYVGPRPMTMRLLGRYSRRCEAIVANSESVAADVRGVLGRVAVSAIHNGVDVAAFSPEGSRADLDALCGLPSPPQGTIRVGLVATFARWKGHELFLAALAGVGGHVPVRGYVVGGPVYDTRGSQYSVEELRAAADRLGLGDRVGFTGFVDQTSDVLRALDVVVHASTDPEPFGMVIAEAMACGRAVVTSGRGGAAELVRDGADAMVFRSGDADALASRIAALAADAGARARLGRAARAAVLERFDARRMTERFAQLYESVARRAVVTR